MSDTLTVIPVRPAVLRLAVAEADALAAFARDLGYTVTAEPNGHTIHGHDVPRWVVVAPSGKDAVLTLAGIDEPVPVVLWLHPMRTAAVKPRAALLAMRLPTSHPNPEGPHQ